MKLAHLFVILSVVSFSLFGSIVVESPGAKAASLSSPPRAITLTANQKQSLDLAVAQDGRIYAVWSERLGTDYDIMFSFSSNNGTSFTSPVQINQQTVGNQVFPCIEVSDIGVIYVAWWDMSSDDGDIVLTRSLDKGRTFQNETRVNSYSSGRQSKPSLAVNHSVVAVAWEDDSSNNTIRIWRAIDGMLVNQLNGHTGAVRSVEFSPNGTMLASGAEDNIVKIWDAQTGVNFFNLTSNTEAVTSLNFSSDGSMLAVGSLDCNVMIWDTSTFNLIARYNGTGGTQSLNQINAVSWFPDNNRIAAAFVGRSGGTSGPDHLLDVTVWNITDSSNYTVNEKNGWHKNSVNDVAVSHNNTMLASCSMDKTIKIWNSTTVAAMTWQNRLLPDPNFVVIGTSQNYTNASVHMPGIINNRTDLSFEVVLEDNINVTRNYAFNITINGVTNNASGSSVPAGATSIIVSFLANSIPEALNADFTIEMFNSTNWQPLSQSTGKIDVIGVASVDLGLEVRSIAWSPTDTHLAAGLSNGSIAVVSASDLTDVYWLLGKHTGRVNSLSWGEIRNEIASGGADPKAKIWDNVTKTERINLTGHQNSVYSIDWSTSGTYLATAGGDTIISSMETNMAESKIMCAVSTNAGLNFSSPVMIADSCHSDRNSPKIAMDANGVISAVWDDNRNSVKDIYFANSTDGGQTFSSNLLVSHFLGAVDDSPAITVEAGGTVHVAWQHQVAGTIMSPIHGIWYANSTDSFLTGQNISGAGQMPKIATSSSGTALWVMWRNPSLTLSAKASFDHGFTFPDTTSVSNTAVANSAVFVDAYNQTSIAWLDWPTVGYSIYYAGTVVTDAWPPSVTGTIPYNSQSGVPIFNPFPMAAPIQINFSEPMDNSTTEAAFSWTDGTQTWRVANCSEVIWSGYGDTVQFRPREPLKYQMNYIIVIGTGARDISGNQLQAQYTFSFSTSNDVDPPIINFTQTLDEINYDKNYTISATIIDQWGTVNSASVHYKGVADATPVNAISMVEVNSTTYNASIPAQMALGNVSFYIEAVDTGGNEGTLPFNLSQGYFNYTVVDQTKPEISHIQVTEAPVYQPIEIWAVVTDKINLTGVELYYKGVQDQAFTLLAMQPGNTTNAFNCTIPAQQNVGDLQYNISARDASGNVNVTSDFVIDIKDLIKPTIHWVRPEYLANNTEVLVRANVTDDVAVDEVMLYFKAVGGNRWVEREMHQVDPVNSPEIYEFTIPAQDRSGNISYYVNATDTTGNIASTLEQEAAYEVEVVGVGTNWLVYGLLIAVLAILVLFFIYLALKKYGGKQKPEMADEPLENNGQPQPKGAIPAVKQESQQSAGKK